MISALAAAAVYAVAAHAIRADSVDPVTAEGLDRLPVANFVGSWIKQVVPGAVLLNEEGAALAAPEPLRFSLYGDSWVWNRWIWDGFDVTDPLNPGTSAFELPWIGLKTIAAVPAESMESRDRGGIVATGMVGGPSRLRASIALSPAGGPVPLAYPLMDAFSGVHAERRDIPPAPLRRHGEAPVGLEFVSTVPTSRAVWTETAVVRRGRRVFNDFGPSATTAVARAPVAHQVDEEFTQTSAVIRVVPHRGRPVADLALDARQRDLAGIEDGRGASQSPALERVTLIPALAWGPLRTNLVMAQERYVYAQRAFAVDVFDADGLALEPFEPDGVRRAMAHRAALDIGPLFVRLENIWATSDPETTGWRQPWTLGGAPYGEFELRARPTRHYLGDNRIGAAAEARTGALDLGAQFYAGETHGAVKGGERLVLAQWGAKAHAVWHAGPHVRPFVLGARTPIAVDTGLLRAIDPGWIVATRVVSTPQGPLPAGSIGGARLADDIRLPWIGSLGAGWEQDLGFSWCLTAQVLGKAYVDTWALRLDGPPDAFGEFANGAYTWTAAHTSYRLGNRREAALYGGAHLQVAGERPDRYALSLALVMYTVVGRPGLGNGPMADDVGAVTFSQADPNGAAYSLANLAVDRAYHTKIHWRQRIWRTLWLATTLAHFDGEPMGLYTIRTYGGRVARVPTQHRGSPYKFTRPLLGGREDFRLDTDIQVSYDIAIRRQTLRLSVLVANALDLGSEIVELQSPYAQTARAALELELPRTVVVAAEWRGF